MQEQQEQAAPIEPIDYLPQFDLLHQDLTGIQESLTDIQSALAETPYTDAFTLIQEKLELIDGKLVEPISVNDMLCVPVYQQLQPEESGGDVDENIQLEDPETAAPDAKTSEKAAENNSAVEPAVTVDYTEDIQALLLAVKDVNKHLEKVEVYQQNMQNIQIPIMGCVALVFGGILALICSNYIKH